MGTGTLFGSLAVVGVSGGAFWYLLRKQRSEQRCVWIFANGDKSGSRTCLPVGAISVPFVPQYVLVPDGLAFAMRLGNSDSSVTNVSVGGGTGSMLANVIGAGQTVKSVAVTLA